MMYLAPEFRRFYYDAAIAIYSVIKKIKEQENGHHNKCMYILALIEMCKKLCGENSVMSRSNRDIKSKESF